MTRTSAPPPATDVPIYGLVLAGGRGSRIGRDKGRLEYHGMPQAEWAFHLLARNCRRAFVSVRPEQMDGPPYLGLPTIIDRGVSAGPATGVDAAFQVFPDTAWLVVAADMPLLTDAILGTLIAGRDPLAIVTAYRHRDGLPEPLCAIWEPAVAARLQSRSVEQGASLRRLIEHGPSRLLDLADEEALTSVNTAADDTRVRARLTTRGPSLM